MTQQGSRARKPARDVHGILPLDKPQGLTSNRALQRVKHLFGARKAGHTGSLDPLATGMLPICFGAATKISGLLLDAEKTYRVVGRLGVATDTGDADGTVVERHEREPVAATDVTAAAARFLGEIEQVPPMYSALKHGGRRLYELARQGVTVERAARRVRITELTVTRYEWPELELTVTCSKGTYIRSLVIDLAAALGTVGHVTALRRLAVGPFEEADLLSLESLEALAAEGEEALDRVLLPIDHALHGWPSVELETEAGARFLHGQAVPAEASWPPGAVRVYAGGELLGLGEIGANRALAPKRMLRPGEHKP